MAKREQALRIEPKNEIHFKGPYTRVVTEYFHLANPTEKPIAFKVKTTAPKRYCVRPNNGTIAPGKSVNVAVMLQPLTQGDQQAASVAALEKNKHKFMIQSVFAVNDSGNADDLFKSVSPDDIMDSKFRCVFDDTAAVAGGPNAAAGGPGSKASGESDNDSANENPADGGDVAKQANRTNDHAENDGTHFSRTSSSGYSNATTIMADSSQHLTNGGSDEDSTMPLTSARIGSTLAAPSATAAVSSSSGADSAEVKRLNLENHELRAKLQEFERAARGAGGPGAYNRFGASGAAAAASQKSSTSPSSTSTVSPSNLLDQPLSGQVILTVLISLLIGFILGKVDLGLF